MIIDVHGHLGNINLAPFWQADSEKLEKYLVEADVDQLWVTAARSIMYDLNEGNVELSEALRNSTKLLGYVTVNPLFPQVSFKDLELLKEPKFIGVKVHPDYHGFEMSSKAVRKFLHKVAEKTKLFLFHVSCMPGTGFADAKDIADFASEHPNVNFIMAHMGGIFQNDHYPYHPNYKGMEYIKSLGCDNIYVDTAHQLMYTYPGVMEKMVELIGVNNIVFGTDCPLQGPMQIRFAIESIKSLKIDEYDKEKIFFRNAKKLLAK